MGKKHKKKYKYTKHDFINICCSKCRICKEGTDPSLCYSKFYKNDPKEFIKKIFKNLLESKHLLRSTTVNKKCYPKTLNLSNIDQFYSYIPGWVQKKQQDVYIKQIFKKEFYTVVVGR